MWSPSQMISPLLAHHIWEQEASGLAFVDNDKAKKIVERVNLETKSFLKSDQTLRAWEELTGKKGLFGFKAFVQSFKITKEENPFKHVTVKDKSLSPHLRDAVKSNDQEKVKELLLKGADPNYIAHDSILYEAIEPETPLPIIKMLLQAGADQKYCHVESGCHNSSSESCFQKAVAMFRGQNEELINLFLTIGANPNEVSRNSFGGMRTDGSESFYPIHTAIGQNNEKYIHALLEAGANPNALMTRYVSNEYGHMENTRSPALHRAVESKCSLRIIGLLLQYGADINDTKTFLKEVRVAPSSGGDPRRGNYKSGLKHLKCAATPLHLAIIEDNPSLIHFLVMAGADTNIPYIEGEENKSVQDLCKSQLALDALVVEFFPMHYFSLPKEVQGNILDLLLAQKKQKYEVSTDSNYLTFSWMIRIAYHKLALKVTPPQNSKQKREYEDDYF